MKRYQEEIDDLISQIKDLSNKISEMRDSMCEKQEKVLKLEKLQKRLPERHGFPWEKNEKENLKKALMRFISSRAEIHKRTTVSILYEIRKIIKSMVIIPM